MKKYPYNKTEEKPQSTFRKIENMHPHLMLLYLSVFGIFLIFTFLLIAFLYAGTQSEPFGMEHFPKSFVISTLVLAGSSILLGRVFDAYKQESLHHIAGYLGATLVLGTLFCALQFFGWQELSQSEIAFTGEVSGTYLYLISGLHMAHLIGGMVFLIINLVQVKLKANDPVKVLIYTTSPYEVLKLRMLNIYWHSMDALWIILFVVFLFMF